MNGKSRTLALASLPPEDRDEILSDYVYFQEIESENEKLKLALRNCAAYARKVGTSPVREHTDRTFVDSQWAQIIKFCEEVIKPSILRDSKVNPCKNGTSVCEVIGCDCYKVKK